MLEASDPEDGFSMEYGITRRSILDQVPHFDLCICLPHDIMHVILEGVLNLNCKLLLHYLVYEERLFTLKYLNEIITRFPYAGRDAVNAPRVIDREKLMSDSSKITQSGMYMHTFVLIFNSRMQTSFSQQLPRCGC